MTKSFSKGCRCNLGRLWWVALVAIGVLAACNRKTDPNPTVETLGDAKTAPKGANSANPASTPPAAEVDRTFVLEAAASGLVEIEGGRLVADKTRDPAVKSYAEQLVIDHTAANDELKRIASTKGITVLNALDETGKFQLDKLRNGANEGFDAMVIQTLGVDAHTKAIRLFERQASEGRDPELRAFAERTVPKLREHLTMAEQIQAKFVRR